MLPGIASIIGGTGANDSIVFVGGAISIASSATVALNSGLTGGIASSAQSGDFVIGIIAEDDDTDLTMDITDGGSSYDILGTELYVGSTYDINLRAAYKRISADTETTFSSSGNINNAIKGVLVFRGVDAVTPIDVTTTTATGTSGAANPPSITPASQNCFIVAIGAGGQVFESLPVYTASELSDFFTAKNDGALGFGYIPSWPGGACDPAAFAGGSTAAWAAITVAIRSA